MQIKAVIFDMDGLILDTEPVYRRAWIEAANQLGYEIPLELYNPLLGIPNEQGEQMLADRIGNGFPKKEFAKAWRFRFAEIAGEEGLSEKTGLTRLLDTLDTLQIRKAVATSSSCREIAANYTSAPALDRFDIIVTCDDVRNSKPHPEIFLLAARKLQRDPSRCMALEDSNNGMRSALSAGMMAVMVLDLVGPDSDVAEKAYAIVDSLHAVVDIIEKRADKDTGTAA